MKEPLKAALELVDVNFSQAQSDKDNGSKIDNEKPNDNNVLHALL